MPAAQAQSAPTAAPGPVGGKLPWGLLAGRWLSGLSPALLALTTGVALAASGTEPPQADWPDWHPLREDRAAQIREEPSTSMSPRSYEQLSRVHEQLGEGKLDEALASLKRLGTRGLNKYELAQAHQAYGFIYSQQGREEEAFAAFEQCIALDALPSFVQQGIIYSVASYYASQERYGESTDMLMRWFRHEADPAADAYMLAGVNQVQSGNLLAGLPYVQRANALASPPRESWKQAELAILFETKRYLQAIALLEGMLGLWPDRVRYYETLSGLLMETGQESRALSALAIPWLRGLLTEQRQLLALARLNLYLNNPERGAEVLHGAIEAGYVQPSQENLELLLNAHSAARETGRALEVIERLAQQAEDGEYHLRKALLLNETGNWEGVADAAGKALDKGGLERPGEAWILRGVALAELERYVEALEAFASARNKGRESARRNAESWMAYVRDRTGGRP